MKRIRIWAFVAMAGFVALLILLAMDLGDEEEGAPATQSVVTTEAVLEVSATDFAWRVRDLDELHAIYLQDRDSEARSRLLECADELSFDLSMGKLSRDQAEVAYSHLDLMLRMMGWAGMSPHDEDLRDRISIVISTYREQQNQIDAIVDNR